MLGFSVGSIDELAPVLEAYKNEIVNAEPIGAYVNDNVMVTSAAFVAEDREAAVQSMVGGRLSYLQSNVFRYHDTFPHPDWAPKWPELLPDPSAEEVRASIGTPGNVVGDPDDDAEGLPGVGRRRRRPDLLRPGHGHPGGGPRDHPPHR